MWELSVTRKSAIPLNGMKNVSSGDKMSLDFYITITD